jgi:hypothetical protein
MEPQTDSDRRPAKLVVGTVLVLVTVLISVVFIKHFDGRADPSAAAANGNDLTHSGANKGPAAAPASTAAADAPASAAPASAAQEPPNPFKAFVAQGQGAAPRPAKTPSAAPASAAAEPVDPFKAFLESGQASAATAPPTAAPTGQDSQDAQPLAEDPFKEALERQQQKQQQP